MKPSCLFYSDWLVVAQEIKDEALRCKLFDAILHYALDGAETPTLPSELTLLFASIKLQIDRSNERYFEICAMRSEAGKMGGAPKGNTNACKNKQNKQMLELIEETSKTSKTSYNENKKQNQKKNDIIDLSEKPSKSTPKISKAELLEKRKQEFYESLLPFKEQYPAEMLESFFMYWSEPNKSNTKMRFETEKTWSLPLRLRRWAANEKIR